MKHWAILAPIMCPNDSGPDRKAILARREKFVVAALAGAGLSTTLCGCDPSSSSCHFARRNMPAWIVESAGCEYRVCLSISRVPDASPVIDAGGVPDATPDGTSTDVTDPDD